MKKLSLILCGALMLGACTSEAPIEPASTTQESHKTIRSEAEAIEMAENLANILIDSRNETKSVGNVEIIYANSSRANTDTLIYAVNYADNAGYALISAAKTGESIIGFTEKGSYNAETVTENPNFSYYMSVAEEYVANQMSVNAGDISSDLIRDPSRPIVQTGYTFNPPAPNWGQRYPEGIYCPNKISGCVQTASALILSYFQQPGSIDLSYPEKDAESMLLDWQNINKHTKSVSTYGASNHLAECNADEEHHNIIGRLCRELGFRNHANYKANATGAYSEYAIPTLQGLLPDYNFSGLKPFSTAENFRELSRLFFAHKRGIAYIDGFDSDAGGHAWICDNVKKITTTTKYIRYTGEIETVVTTETFFYFNWGWNGTDNGYFAAGVFDNKKPSSRYNFSDGPRYCFIYK